MKFCPVLPYSTGLYYQTPLFKDNKTPCSIELLYSINLSCSITLVLSTSSLLSASCVLSTSSVLSDWVYSMITSSLWTSTSSDLFSTLHSTSVSIILLCVTVYNNIIILLELQSLALLLLVTTQLEVLTSLQRQLSLGLADNTLQSQDDLLGGLSLLVENWLGLTTETGLLSVISSLTLSEQGSLTSLVLGNLVLGVLTALLTLTVGLSSFWDVNYSLLVLVK